ncbi:MAG: hypothetical protein V7K27_28340 [Nostoc sp.]|uniref:hypothetical protein n=1 Tax=Nostoc sp. TaxID=1180 RepID=UPI002FF7D27A
MILGVAGFEIYIHNPSIPKTSRGKPRSLLFYIRLDYDVNYYRTNKRCVFFAAVTPALVYETLRERLGSVTIVDIARQSYNIIYKKISTYPIPV